MDNNKKYSNTIPKEQFYESLADVIRRNNSQTLKDIIYSVASELGYSTNEFHYDDIADRVSYAVAVYICTKSVLKQQESLATICKAYALYIMGDVLHAEAEEQEFRRLYIDGCRVE